MKEYFERLYTFGVEEYYQKLNKYLSKGTKKFIITANPETFKISQTNKDLEKEVLNPENDIVPDGIAIVKAAKHYGINVKERVTGYDIAVKLLELANEKKRTAYFFGAKKEVMDNMLKVVEEKYPGIKVVGYSDGYVEDKDAIFDEIIKLKPDIVLVALGIPLQETMIAKHIGRAKKGIFIGVGGSFDVISGSKKRAPKIFIKLNLEWLYRITSEPSRLKRFYQNNIKFMFEVFKDKKDK